MTAPYPCVHDHPDGINQTPKTVAPALDLTKFKGSYAALGQQSYPVDHRFATKINKDVLPGFSRQWGRA